MRNVAHVGLVLGAGGLVGHAYHAGVLRALSDHGWDARSAAVVVGTSAGSGVGALLAPACRHETSRLESSANP